MRCNVRRDGERLLLWYFLLLKRSFPFASLPVLHFLSRPPRPPVPVPVPHQALSELGVGSSFLSILNKLTQVRGQAGRRVLLSSVCLRIRVLVFVFAAYPVYLCAGVLHARNGVSDMKRRCRLIFHLFLSRLIEFLPH